MGRARSDDAPRSDTAQVRIRCEIAIDQLGAATERAAVEYWAQKYREAAK